MALREGTVVNRGYVTVSTDDGGVNYRDIAETMTELGHPMNHSSARNHVIRIMRRFVNAIAAEYGIDVAPDNVDDIAKSPAFQQAMAEVLQTVESERRVQRDATILRAGGMDETCCKKRPQADVGSAVGQAPDAPANIS